jgi:MSHA pilin protein MshD
VTLVELVVAITVIAIGVTAVLNVIGVGSRASVEPQLRVKTTELAQTYMDEIYSAKWDESQVGGGCVDTGSGNCESGPAAQCPGSCGPDSGEGHISQTGRASLDDVDDYEGLCEGTAGSCTCAPDGPLRGADGEELDSRYGGFCVDIVFTPNAGGDLKNIPDADAKGITITVTDPQGNEADFSAYRLNY